MDTVNRTSNQLVHMTIQDTDFESLIETKIPPELLATVFSILSFEDITSTCCVIKRWSIISLDVAQRHLNECFKPYICSIVKNLKDLQCIETMKKVENLLMTVAVGNKAIQLPRLKSFLTYNKVTLTTFFADLGAQKINILITLSENVKTPYFFHDVFKMALDCITPQATFGGQLNREDRIFPAFNMHMRISRI